jgi:hypothetical protein
MLNRGVCGRGGSTTTNNHSRSDEVGLVSGGGCQLPQVLCYSGGVRGVRCEEVSRVLDCTVYRPLADFVLPQGARAIASMLVAGY